MCKKCVLKSSLHNPCIANCIGYHNEKFFFLYLLYSLLLNWVFIEAGMRHSFFSDTEAHVFLPFRVFYWVMNVLTYPMTFAYTMMAISFFMAFWNNVTMLERMRGRSLNCPCCPSSLANRDRIRIAQNVYDHLWLQNLSDVLCSSMWKWLLPIRSSMVGNGYHFPKIPEMDIQDIKKMQEEQAFGDQIEELESEESLNSLKKYFEKCHQEYSGKHLYVYNNMFAVQ